MKQSPLTRILADIFLFLVAVSSLGIIVYDVIAGYQVQLFILAILYSAITSATTIAGLQITSSAMNVATTNVAGITADAMSKGMEVGTKVTNGNGNH